jgi:hypothetical protein
MLWNGRKTKLILGLGVCVVAAVLMVVGIFTTEVGLVVGTLGMLTVASASSGRDSEPRDETR